MDVPHNPIATPEQNAHERRALELFADPKVAAAREEVRAWWLASRPRSEDALACFEWAFEEVMFAAVVWSLNQDPLHPKVITITRLEHTLDGVRVPGTRWGIDNPDSVYRVIPISGDERYVIRGRVPENRVTENYFTLWDEKMSTVDVLDGKSLVLDDDRRFEIFVDSDPKGDRPNHIRSAPEAHEFFIRDVVMDWEREMINDLEIERLGPPPPRPPAGPEEEVERAIETMWRWAKETDRWNRQSEGTPDNEFAYTIDRDSDGALRNQIYVFGTFKLDADDQALVLTVDLGGADYFIAPITNAWGTSTGIRDRTGSLNRAQSVANPDGTLTFVLSKLDPGVHNWLDPFDLREGFLTLRWAEFAGGKPGESLSVRSELVSLGDLEKKLPEGTRFVTPEERRVQQDARARAYAWRLMDR